MYVFTSTPPTHARTLSPSASSGVSTSTLSSPYTGAFHSFMSPRKSSVRSVRPDMMKMLTLQINSKSRMPRGSCADWPTTTLATALPGSGHTMAQMSPMRKPRGRECLTQMCCVRVGVGVGVEVCVSVYCVYYIRNVRIRCFDGPHIYDPLLVNRSTRPSNQHRTHPPTQAPSGFTHTSNTPTYLGLRQDPARPLLHGPREGGGGPRGGAVDVLAGGVLRQRHGRRHPPGRRCAFDTCVGGLGGHC